MEMIEKKKGNYDKEKMFKDGANLSPSTKFLLREEITDLLETADFRIKWSKKHKAPYPFSNLDQSQKQPEGVDQDYKEGLKILEEQTKRTKKEVKEWIKSQPEKQEEWREELKYACLNDALLSSKTHRWLDDVIGDYEKYGMESCSDSDVVLSRLKDLREFLFNYYSAGNGDSVVREEVSQLLSERTFTKEELENIKFHIDFKRPEDGVDIETDRLREKVSKLLKEQE
jgi:hypothetical protein